MKKLVAPLAVTAAVVTGGIAGAMIGVPAISDAQETQQDAPADEAPAFRGPRGRGPDGEGRGGPGRGFHHRGPGLDAAAEALGIETTELVDALRDGQTIAEVAQEKGVDVQTVIDAMVADATERIEDFVNNGPKKRPAAPDAPNEGGAEAEPEAEGSRLAS